MTRRIRLLLPLAQVLLAVVLVWSNFHQPASFGDPSWAKPDRQFCDGLNAPATLIRSFLVAVSDRWWPGNNTVNVFLETFVFFCLVGLVWYLASVEIGGSGRSVLTQRTGFRRAADLFAILFGVAIGVAGSLHSANLGTLAAYRRLVAIPYLAWAALIVTFYGRDLYLVLKRR